MKQRAFPQPVQATRLPASDHGPAQRAAVASPGADVLLGSTRLLAQRQAMQAQFGSQALQPAGLEEEEPLQGQGLPLQREAMEEEELLQGQGLALQRMEEEEPLQGQGLPPALAAGVQQLSGADMSNVRVHAESPQPARVGALAYAQGNDIHLAPGQERHLPHEAWHVAQQKAGRVQPTLQAAGVPINDSPALEAEADRMGALALQTGQQAAAQRRRRR